MRLRSSSSLRATVSSVEQAYFEWIAARENVRVQLLLLQFEVALALAHGELGLPRKFELLRLRLQFLLKRGHLLRGLLLRLSRCLLARALDFFAQLAVVFFFD